MDKFFTFVYLFMLLSLNGRALRCNIGNNQIEMTSMDCDDESVTYCVKYDDHYYSTTYFFCDYTNVCTQQGYTNMTEGAMTCCITDECNSDMGQKLGPHSTQSTRSTQSTQSTQSTRSTQSPAR